MKYLILLGLVTGVVWARKTDTTGTKVKRGINTAAERIDTGTRKVIYKGRSAWEKRHMDKEAPKRKQSQEDK